MPPRLATLGRRFRPFLRFHWLTAELARTVVLHPLPPRIIEIVPAYASYQYFVLADGTILIVDPGTFNVVYVIPA